MPIVRKREREKERDREGERQTDRQDKQTDRQRDRQTDIGFVASMHNYHQEHFKVQKGFN